MNKQGTGIKLESLIDLSNKLNQTYDEKLILNAIVLSLMGKLKMLKACIFIPDKQRINLNVAISKGKTYFDNIPYFEPNELQKLNQDSEQFRILLDFGFQYCQPISYDNIMIALICLGKKYDNNDLSEDEKKYVQLVSAISSNALKHAKKHSELIRAKNDLESRNQLLSTFFEISRDFSALLNKSQIIKMLSYRLMGQLMVSRFAVFHKYGNNRIELLINRFKSNLKQTTLQELFNIKEIKNVDEVNFSSDTIEELIEMNAKVCSPMLHQGETKGLLIIGKKMNNEEFSTENIQFLEALGNIAISSLENDRLFFEELEKKKLENEMLLALEIQKKLLPTVLPNIEGFQIFCYSQPSRLVGGDYYDIIKVSENKYLITIADVSGKGMPAALLMANVQAVLRVLAPLSISLSELISRLNTVVYHNTNSDKFVTLFCGYLDLDKQIFQFINAGHNPPFIVNKNNEIKYLNEGGLILGIFEDSFNYEVGKIQVEEESTIIFYTDGITEALNESNEEYGLERFQSLVLENIHCSPQVISDRIVSEINKFSSGLMSDDITLIILKS